MNRSAGGASDIERELAEAREQQSAIAEILRVMADAPADVTVVLNAIAKEAAQLCRAPFARMTVIEGDILRPIAGYAADDEPAAPAGSVPLARTSIQGRAIVERRTLQFDDIAPLVEKEFPAAVDNARSLGFRAVLAVPLLRGEDALGAIFLYRREPGLFSPVQVALVETFARQAAIALHSVQQFRATQDALEQQTATSEILRVINRARDDVQPVFDTIAENALKLCDAIFSAVYRFDGQLIHIAALRNISPAGDLAFRRIYPAPPGPQGTTQRAILTGTMVHMPDVRLEPDFGYLDVAAEANYRSALAVPMLRDGVTIGAITVYRESASPFPDAKISLLKTFADQAVIAVENVRLFNELGARNRALTEALEQQTATSGILRVISRSPTDVQPVFDTISTAALNLCRAASALVTRVEGDQVILVSSANLTDEGARAMHEAFPMPVGRQATSARAIREGRMILIPDVLEDPDYKIPDHALRAAFRSTLAVPLMRDGRPIGTITVGKPEPGPFPDSQVALLETFAEQAVIAIENVRLFNELDARNRALTESLEQQTATSEILRVISQSRTDVQPVFDTIAQAALDLCGAVAANVFTYDGSLVHVASVRNASQDYVKALKAFFPRPPSRETAVLRAILTGRINVVPDVLEDSDYVIGDHSAAGGFRSVIAVPLLHRGSPVGGIAVGRPVPGPFPDSQVSLLQTFADQAVIAIENVRLFNELNARTAQLARSVNELRALGDVGQAVSSTLDLSTVLSTIVSRARALTGVEGASVYEYDEAREAFILRSSDGLPADLIEALNRTPMRPGEGALGRMALTHQPVEIGDVADERAYQSRVRKLLVRLDLRSMLAVPLLRESHLLGGLVVNRRAPGAFDPQVVELLKTFATQSALAIQNARLYREIEIKSRELETASRHKSEFLANMSHELRTPLNAIIGFSEVLSERLFGELNAKQAEYVVDIAESGRHLLMLINDILDLSKIEAGRMELDASEMDLARTIEQTLVLVRERAERRGIALSCAIGSGVGAIHADARKVKQVLLNLLSNALKFTPAGGRVDVGAAAFDDRVEVSVSDTGIGIAPEDQDAVFEEFRQVGASAAKSEGTGLGLAISRKFIELHGGRIFLQSTPGVGSTFTFTLPVRH
ncbi:MAG: GAF domain-containing protein [Burkholderiales bacterium]